MANNKNIRSSQLLTPFGIGQIINFPKEYSLMVCGLDLWDENIQKRKSQAGQNKINESALRFNERRLEKLLGVKYFVRPFPFKTSSEENNMLKIPCVRFPGWHYCTNSGCGYMKEVELGIASDTVQCDICQGKDYKTSKMIPVRFVAVCSAGHIQDVPFLNWVHRGPLQDDEEEHSLFYQPLPGSGDLGSILIKCSCGERRTLAGLMNIKKTNEEIIDSALARIGLPTGTEFDLENRNDNNPAGEYCKGHRPWLGQKGLNNARRCGNHLQVLIRGGSNVHFSNIVSALYLPEVSSEANEYVVKFVEKNTREKLMKLGKSNWHVLVATDQNVKIGLIGEDELLSGVIKELADNNEKPAEDSTGTITDLRIEEYKYILNGRDSENTSFKAIRKDFESGTYLSKFFECIVLVEKLKETRVFTGFSRINPNNRLAKEELSNDIVKWLPAIEVFGEGVFLKFNDKKIDEWEHQSGGHFSQIFTRYAQALSRRSNKEELRDLNASFIMMHTFAHLLIKRLCFSCGYGSSSLRERIYYSADPENRMNGILIYTSSGDTEGSLGGLVRQGREEHLEKLVKEAIEDARWCSADPVCSDIGQGGGQGPDSVNGSACHNCCIVPETSCEEFNMLLDRATIVGTLDENVGFFQP